MGTFSQIARSKGLANPTQRMTGVRRYGSPEASARKLVAMGQISRAEYVRAVKALKESSKTTHGAAAEAEMASMEREARLKGWLDKTYSRKG